MLSPELHAVVLEHIHTSALSKAAHIHYTAQKCFRLRERMLVSAAECREEAQSLSLVLNRQYRLVNLLTKTEGETENHPAQRQLLKLAREQYQQTGHIQTQLSGVSSGLALSADNLLFTLLKAQHYRWRDRLYVAILTERPDDLLEDERECTLGRWIHGEGVRRFRALPGFRELDTTHHRMHEVSRALFERKLDSFSVKELRKTLQATEEASQQLIIALDRLDERVNLLYPGGNTQS
ncbi:TPA: CZB domain-containing protein [Citrobacter braakii]